jgi:hypothetical protein
MFSVSHASWRSLRIKSLILLRDENDVAERISLQAKTLKAMNVTNDINFLL